MREFREILWALSLLKPRDINTGYKIRIGSPNDGGYILLDPLRAPKKVFSYGISWNVSFELDLAARGMPVFVFNNNIEKPLPSHKHLHFPAVDLPGEVGQGAFLSFKDHVEIFSAHDDDMLLKIDIEGEEWDGLIEAPTTTLQRFEQIVVEFHWFHLIGDVSWRTRATRVLEKLHGIFSIFHVHANNFAPIALIEGFPVADVLQVSYIRSDLIPTKISSTLFPTSLDAPNDIRLRDHLLWFYPFMPGGGIDDSRTALREYDAVADRTQKQAVDGGLHSEHDSLHRPVDAPIVQASTRDETGFAAKPQRSPGSLPSARSLKILCISVHPVLEYDEIQLFEAMGHQVFSLGFFTARGHDNPANLRPPLQDTDWHRECRVLFQTSRCLRNVPQGIAYRVTPAFCSQFDVIIVHHNYHFIAANWDAISGVPVVWRTIGQGAHWSEEAMRAFRKHVKIVRWSPEEERIKGYIGADALIRASKDHTEWGGWQGNTREIVTFNNDFMARSNALNFTFHQQCVNGFPFKLYGLRNQGLPDWQGAVSYVEQQAILRNARVTFVTGTNPAPYTLGFVEAWITGAPVVHVGRGRFSEVGSPTYEIDRFIEHGTNGFLVDDVSEATSCFTRLLDNEELARSISARGREAAVRIFGRNRAITEWRAFFDEHIR